jgi:hypothetical protein
MSWTDAYVFEDPMVDLRSDAERARIENPRGIWSVIAGRPVPSSTQPDHTLPSTTSISYVGNDDEDTGTRPALDAKHLTLMTARLRQATT